MGSLGTLWSHSQQPLFHESRREKNGGDLEFEICISSVSMPKWDSWLRLNSVELKPVLFIPFVTACLHSVFRVLWAVTSLFWWTMWKTAIFNDFSIPTTVIKVILMSTIEFSIIESMETLCPPEFATTREMWSTTGSTSTESLLIGLSCTNIYCPALY